MTSAAPSMIGRSLRRHRGRLLAAIALLCLWQLCEAAVPVAIGLIIDRAVLTGSIPAMVVSLIGLTALFGVLSMAYRHGARTANVALHRETHQLRVEVAERALDPRGVRTDLMPGEVLSIASADADTAGLIFRQLALTGAGLCGVLATAGYLLITDWLVGIVIILGVPLVLGAVHLLTPRVSRHAEEQQGRIAAASGQAADLMRGLRVLKGIGGEAAAGERYRRTSQRARAAGVATIDGIAIMEGIRTFMIGLLVAVVVLVAGWRLITGRLTPGELVAVVGLATFLAEPVGLVAALVPMLARTAAAGRRIRAFLGLPPLVQAGDRAPGDAPADLRLSGLRAGPAAEFDLDCGPGELVVLACGDPAVVREVLEVLDARSRPRHGHVLLAGVPRDGLDPVAAAALITVAPHQVDLFAGSLAHNVFGAEGEPGPREREVLAAAAVDELLGLFPDGLAHPLAAEGANLSGGQRQRIALARALAADRPVLVLHDPTTAVDAVTELAIARGCRSVRSRSATLVITTSPAFCALADRVVVVDEAGSTTGRHDDLLRTSAAYRRLVQR
ncbi:putative ABC transport system ATP-binding protein [Naumannella cuiyingiana]|uniref:Putative ABC transport system ATP-binding protein n=1 Tax=Naumannella cuiyingiana TaxID=1347891 RepID=A0A7Z0D6W8_9ACTN|nr:putative ABC transport system ATP-binding protein [Naumannella cuiyingiana]